MIVDIHYKYEDAIPWLQRIQRQWWRRKRTRDAAALLEAEVTVIRQRLSYAVVEISEWRAKIGEAAYSRPGPVFAEMVEAGIRNRIGTWLSITDEDFRT